MPIQEDGAQIGSEPDAPGDTTTLIGESGQVYVNKPASPGSLGDKLVVPEDIYTSYGQGE